ncbi:MAG TPA: SRPBCC domain-containing protein [Methyloceanibacter sp.]|nr:SRPBCC domain-containing protein [Methyloceanibacter sp.]
MSKQDPFVIARTFNAPLDRVWKAWTEPEQMAQWWGPKGFTASPPGLRSSVFTSSSSAASPTRMEG